ncbi:AAA family ATPase [Tumebacillus permanentifrigoris]|uniref:MoxR-like ATPase n=1 Tax=Tumebacillus permanentifrigoris TaxID=378543 RepID=A0A316D5Y8_9BACL|nr:MoxR family ATPase [Tumebacillus permanentifrigoris]PWK09656.1 MoxR-like ATPase [Tumebacillus permanentifrigoris]
MMQYSDKELVNREFDNPHQVLADVVTNVEHVIVGKSRAVQLCLVALLCDGHVLLEDVPGVGKTMLVRSLAKTLGCSFKRIQFTPDLLPSDVTGISIYNQKTADFEFRPGPIMANVVLADEINRTSPKTQSALLEAMEESNVTVDGTTYRLPSPFLVMATQNPIEYEGTFPLPEAQLDRFLLKLNLGYPSQQDEIDMLGRQQLAHPIDSISQVTDLETLQDLQKKVREVHVEESIREYIVTITTETRKHQAVYLGASPRGSLGLFRAAQALAFILGRTYVVPDDIKQLVPVTLGHRIILKSEARLGGQTVDQVLVDILKGIPVPVTREKVR